MRLIVNHRSSVERAEALFVSPLQPSQEPGARQVQRAVAEAIRQFGSQECAARVAAEYGEHPESAVARMRWACVVVTDAYHGPGLAAIRRRRSARRPEYRAA
jgi:hypothetical protein